MSTRIILDCDPGHDDAMAIVLAQGAPEIELVAITTVAGNHGLELTTLDRVFPYYATVEDALTGF